MPATASKRLEWAPRALEAYIASLSRIAEDDPRTAARVRARVDHALGLILAQPGIGTPALRRGERRFPVPGTGHVITYRVMRHAVRVQLWYRARQHIRD